MDTPQQDSAGVHDLAAAKLREEIESIRAERAASRLRLYLDGIRAAAVIIGAVVLFWVIQRPDSILTRATSQESISRERARLVLEWMKEPDPSKRREALAVIRATYGAGEDDWVKRAEDVLAEQANGQAITEALGSLQVLIVREDSLRKAFLQEIDGTGGSGYMGNGPVARAIAIEVERIHSEINTRKLQLANAGYDTTRIWVTDSTRNVTSAPIR